MRCHRFMRLSTEQRFWCKVNKTDNGCWNWLAAPTTAGYGAFLLGKTRVKAHRMAYMLLLGDIPAGHDLHHVCENKLCVNPAHLLPVTRRDHIVSCHEGFIAQQASQTHCKRGHEFTTENTSFHHTSRQCRACVRLLTNDRRAAKRQEVL